MIILPGEGSAHFQPAIRACSSAPTADCVRSAASKSWGWQPGERRASRRPVKRAETNSRAAASTALCLESGAASSLEGPRAETPSPRCGPEIKLEPTTGLQITFALDTPSTNIVIDLP